jgi:hypothetical protein
VAGLLQPRGGAADLGFLHIHPRLDIAHRHVAGMVQMRQHPPFGIVMPNSSRYLSAKARLTRLAAAFRR